MHSLEQELPPNDTEYDEGQLQLFTSASRVHNLPAFIHSGVADLRAAWPTTSRFFKRGLAQKYRYSSLGLLWAVVPSIITATVLIASQKAKVILHGAGDVPPAFYGVFGLALAQTFLDGMNAAKNVFSANQFLLRRSNVPIEGLIGAAVLDAAFSSLVRMLVLVVAFLFFSVSPSRTAPLAVCGLLSSLFLGCGAGLFLAPINSLKRDIENIMGFLPWILFAITPVFVKPSAGSPAAALYAINPLSWVFDSTRTLAYNAHGHHWPAVVALPASLAVLAVAWAACRVWHPYVVERLLV